MSLYDGKKIPNEKKHSLEDELTSAILSTITVPNTVLFDDLTHLESAINSEDKIVIWAMCEYILSNKELESSKVLEVRRKIHNEILENL